MVGHHVQHNINLTFINASQASNLRWFMKKLEDILITFSWEYDCSTQSSLKRQYYLAIDTDKTLRLI